MNLGTNDFLPFLKFGSHKEKKIFDTSTGKELYRGLIVGATIIESSYAATSAFIKSLGKPFFVDPVTYAFQRRIESVLDKNREKVKKSFNAIARNYGNPIDSLVGKRPLFADDFLGQRKTVTSIVERVIKYQRERIKGEPSLFDDVEEFLEAQGSLTGNGRPMAIIPPYFYFKNPNDPWYKVNLKCSTESLGFIKRNEDLFPLLLVSGKCLNDSLAIQRIASDFSKEGFSGYLLWINSFNEESESAVRHKGLVEFVRQLSANGKSVIKLYGGLFSFFLHSVGLTGFSAGPNYGISKNAFAYGGGGASALPNFYIPRLRISFQLDEAEALLRRYPSLRCTCPVCRRIYGDQMEHFLQMKEGGRCVSHFLNVRKREVDEFRENGLDKLKEDIKETISDFKSEPLVSTRHLKIWLEAIS